MALTKVIGAGLGTLTEDLLVTGTTPKITIGDAGAEDTAIVFDGNAQDFYIGLDDTNDNLSIGLGSTIGSTQLLKFTSGDIVINEDSADINFRVEGNGDATLLKCDAGEDNVKIKTDNNYAALVIENDDAGSQERALYASVTATSGTSANNVALFSATHSNMTNPLVRIHHEDPSADQLLIQATTTGSNTVKFSVDEDGDIYSAGNLVIGTSGKGIDFSATSDATGATDELLDDYEIGVYTPTVTGATSGSYTVGDSATKLAYTKIGKMVHLQGQIHITGKSSPSGVVNVSLPFASGNSSDLAERSAGSVIFDSAGSSDGVAHNSGNFVNFMVSSNSSVGIFRSSEENTGAGSLNQSHLDTNDRFTIGITYMTFA